MLKLLIQHNYHLNKSNLFIGLNTLSQCLNCPSLRNDESLFNLLDQQNDHAVLFKEAHQFSFV